ncbi:MAG: rhomboid family intramembrane serine protease, partial [Thermodesulfobacteriota bacterium]
MFLHGGIFHLLGNMWSLYIFGDNVEDRLGSLRYLLFYFLCGLASGLFHLFINLESNIPTIGASGAIAGVMGAYFITFPGAKVLTLIPILFIPYFVEIPAFIFLGIWFVFQFLSAAGSSGNMGGIAWWAHIGGFVVGMISLKFFGTVPSAGFTEKIRRVTERKKTRRLQMIHPSAAGDDPHLYGSVVITPFEAYTGTHKLINIPWGFTKRIFRVAVPPGTKEGSRLRLKGQGKRTSDGSRGDLFLTVSIKS